MSGFGSVLLGCLGFRSRRWQWLPNRNYLSGKWTFARTSRDEDGDNMFSETFICNLPIAESDGHVKITSNPIALFLVTGYIARVFTCVSPPRLVASTTSSLVRVCVRRLNADLAKARRVFNFLLCTVTKLVWWNVLTLNTRSSILHNARCLLLVCELPTLPHPQVPTFTFPTRHYIMARVTNLDVFEYVLYSRISQMFQKLRCLAWNTNNNLVFWFYLSWCGALK